MKFRPEHETADLLPQTSEVLTTLRERRNFDPENYLAAKAQLLNTYMSESNLKACVVAVSGGIDSALALGIVSEAAKLPDSPIEHIYPITLPVYHDAFTKNQDVATARARELCSALGQELIEVDLTKTYDAIKEAVDEAVGVVGEPWAAGQLVAYLRTPANYYVTSLTTQLGGTGIVCGTTNRDEGAYLGYVGKASDGIADVQLISDLHKSEVRALSRHLGVPQSILEATPTGDMFDGRVDEEVFGTSYDYVELFLLLKSLDPREAKAIIDALDPNERAAVTAAFDNLEELHRYNAHKYNVGSPAVHLDIKESGVPGGWKHARQKVSRKPEGKEYFVNAFDLSSATEEQIYQELGSMRDTSDSHSIDLPKGEALVVGKAVSKQLLDLVLSDADTHGWQPVGIDGIVQNYKDGDNVGSLRASTFSPEFADYLWSRVSKHIDSPRIFDDDPQVDVAPGSVWRPIGVSPLHRFIRYDSDGLLIPHYDAPYAYSEELVTLKSLVVYACAEGIVGGGTRFLHDERLAAPVATRDLSDRESFANQEDVLQRVNPDTGSVLLFDHRLLHDAEPVEATRANGRKVIIRTDVVYTRC